MECSTKDKSNDYEIKCNFNMQLYNTEIISLEESEKTSEVSKTKTVHHISYPLQYEIHVH